MISGSWWKGHRASKRTGCRHHIPKRLVNCTGLSDIQRNLSPALATVTFPLLPYFTLPLHSQGYCPLSLHSSVAPSISPAPLLLFCPALSLAKNVLIFLLRNNHSEVSFHVDLPHSLPTMYSVAFHLPFFIPGVPWPTKVVTPRFKAHPLRIMQLTKKQCKVVVFHSDLHD